MSALRRLLLLTASVLLALVPAIHAQVTTGTIAGVVTAKSDGSALPGVTIEAVHVPTGTRYESVTGSSGLYVIPNVRVGGPYRVTATLEGFRREEKTGVNVRLGMSEEVPLAMELAAVAEAITVTAEADPIINPNRTGSTSAVSETQIESLPTVNRSLQDFARTNPYFNIEVWDATATRMTVAGRNNRYNSIQIDGAVNNDLFGLADTGTPGGQANTQPISLDAVEQLQLVVSPYDVRQGGFTGGGVNAVTRSGSNDISGSVFGTKKDQSFVGDGPFDRPIADFDQDQYGGRIGGPILRDRLFFFVNGELNRREQPTGTSADNTTGVVFRCPDPNNPATCTGPAQVARVAEILRTQHGYDPGPLGDIVGQTDSDLAFGRLDWNVGNSHQLTLRHNYVSAVNDTIGNRSTSQFRFPTSIYTFSSETNSTVAQLNSVFGPSAFNEGRITYQTIRDQRNVPVAFPSIEIGGREQGADINAGTERFSGANALDQDILEITDDFTFIAGNHNITLGTSNQLFEFGNLFLSDFYGYYFFPTVADFEAGRATIYRIGFVNGPDPRRKTQFGVNQFGFYAGDQWRVNSAFSLTVGLRADIPRFTDTPAHNPLVQSALGFRTDRTPSESAVISPRVGFNWQLPGTQQVRGGVGIFAGRTPYVWVSNAYQNTGIETSQLGCLASAGCTPPPFTGNINAQPRDLGAAGAPTVDIVDPDFQMPRVMRATLGYDRELFFGVRGSIEGVWDQTLQDVYYQNVNRREVGTSPLDGRPTYERVTTQIVDALLLTNTDEGESLMWSVQLNRPFSRGFTVSASYASQDAKSTFEGTSSRAISNWRFHTTRGDIFEPELSRAFFEVKHRFNAAVTYAFNTGPLGHSVGLFYNAQTGHPYTLLMGGDPNRDLNTSNDILYVPASESEIILQNASRQVIPYSTLATFLQSVGVDPTAGRILDRNEQTEPWTRQLDFHYELGLPILGTVNTAVTFDVMNLTNLFDSDAGVIESVPFQTYTPIFYAGQDSATGKPIYRENFLGALNPGRQFSTADFRSRWNARLGLRVSF